MKEGTVFIVIIFPRPWPPHRDLELMSWVEGKSQMTFFADVRGYLYLRVVVDGNVSQVVRTKPILILGPGKAILSVIWSVQEVSIRINGVDAPVKQVGLEDLPANPFPIKRSGGMRMFDRIDSISIRNEADHLFVETVQDIDQKIFEGSRYSLIRAAGLLRQLLLDGMPLVDVVNRELRLKLEFEIIDYTEPVPQVLENAKVRFLNPDVYAFTGARTFKTDRAGFLKAPCLIHCTRLVTVKDVIKACANARGGVHFGKPQLGAETIVLQADDTLRLMGQEPSLKTVEGIARVALRALAPLVMQVLKAHRLR